MNAVDGSDKRAAYAEFKAALLDFSDAPNPASLARYLHASRALEPLTPPAREVTPAEISTLGKSRPREASSHSPAKETT
jgi:hypothetical protein